MIVRGQATSSWMTHRRLKYCRERSLSRLNGNSWTGRFGRKMGFASPKASNDRVMGCSLVRVAMSSPRYIMTLEHISYRDFILATCVAFSVRLSWFMHIASTHIVLMPLQGRKNRSIELQFFVCSSTSQYGHIDWFHLLHPRCKRHIRILGAHRRHTLPG
jgi:hypothetical protein